MCLLSFLYSLSRSSTVSVVFDYNDSLNDVAPVSPMVLSVDMVKKEKNGLMIDVICVSSFFCIHDSD